MPEPDTSAQTESEAEVPGTGGRASERIADYLRRALLNEEFSAGERIRQEALAKRLGASRLPVREALRTLEGEGLVTLEPNKGARVTALDSEELDLLYGARARLEPLVIAESVPHLPEARLRRAGQILDTIESGVNTETFLVLDREFHLLTYEGCRSTHLTLIVERLWNSTQHYRRAFITQTGSDWVEATSVEHRLLYHAVLDRNAEVAAAIIASHITRTRVALRRAPEIFAKADKAHSVSTTTPAL